MGNGADDRLARRDREAEARAKGFETEECNVCGNLTLARRGEILHCMTCGHDQTDSTLPVQLGMGAIGAH